MIRKSNRERRPDRLSTYFYQERRILAGITLTGILYNACLLYTSRKPSCVLASLGDR